MRVVMGRYCVDWNNVNIDIRYNSIHNNDEYR